ncbi:hypothetical protein K474DRAFT_1679334 [Panus rudis PR-1116 ss-1]|nr:hypothetical protein K474DRAFT_1679334 [Panus rudis PR-1116 ss-1]
MTQTFGAIIPSAPPSPAGPVSEVEVPSSGLPMLPTPTLPAGGVAAPSGVPQAGPDVPASGIPTPPGTDATLPTTLPSGVPSMDTSSVLGPTDLTDKAGDLIGDVSKNVAAPNVPSVPVSDVPPFAPTVPTPSQAGLPTKDGLPISIPDLPLASMIPSIPNTPNVKPSETPTLPIAAPNVRMPEVAVPSDIPNAPVALPVSAPSGQA